MPGGSQLGRIVITDCRPEVEGGARPARAVPGECFEVSATVFKEGHDVLAAEVVLVGPGPGHGLRAVREQRFRMTERVRGTDRFGAEVRADLEGEWQYRVEAWVDPVGSWLRTAHARLAAGLDGDLPLWEGADLLDRAAEELKEDPEAHAVLAKVADVLRDDRRSWGERISEVLAPAVGAALAAHPLREHPSTGPLLPLRVDRTRALYGSWYEFFPRSEGAVVTGPGPKRSGTLRQAAARLDAIAGMGFDVVYLPPIHPIGSSHRKGPENSLNAEPGDPGSPWAIGSEDGGHDAVHPDLGTLADFRDFVARAESLGLEVAMDFALQCSPDHPWVTEHPEWFRHRFDGSIACAENPPKKYQDIYPIDFDTDPEGILQESLRVLRHWRAQGVRIFRVDNPHTKPLRFWERLIEEVRSEDPGVVFLAEAFTRPAMLQSLARVGFHQSYSYFTWRTGKVELTEYLSELAGLDGSPSADYLRPNLFVNTPDILPGHLQTGGRAAFEIRAVLAATAGPTWGVYSGFELCESVAAWPGSEEYRHSEKYEYRPRDYAGAEDRGESLTPLITRLNRIRRRHPALRQLRNLRFHRTDNDQLLCFSKRLTPAEGEPGGEDLVLVVLNLDPYRAQHGRVRLDMAALGLRPGESFVVDDALSGGTQRWGHVNQVRLDPRSSVAQVLVARRSRA
ncbi:alpha-1,4-glucan--maltose-1-phosphate maltosyltransferase [Streptacidiphilus sp. N1-3]|uniref:Alpha-1,4-glucan:maltose-1-phosphate maltosyltransferase n=1 Tax=Streptacidiphilus alkalitolerans TaxID=3342712 RepID=A0ABV6WVU4_9ACTN